jgi:hypothetical protein
MAELADAADSKSAGPRALGGSIPPPGTSRSEPLFGLSESCDAMSLALIPVPDAVGGDGNWRRLLPYRPMATAADADGIAIFTESGCVHLALPLVKSRRFIVTFNC